MTQPIDIKMTKDSDGIYDISIDADGDLEKDYGFRSPVLMSLIERRRANEGEVPAPENRGGWIGNLLSDIPEYERGSKLWLLGQARVQEDTPAQAKNYIIESLEWMLDDGLADRIEVEAKLIGPKITATIDISGAIFYYDMWNNTLSE